MIAEQLKAARAAHWRQNQSPILTLEDAQSWIEQHPLSLFLPRKAQLPVPAPSLVEAVLGESNATPPQEAIERALDLLIRLIDSGHAVALNLFGALGEQPDFVAQTEILPFAVSFRGERDWKQPPGKPGGQKVSPLVLDLWKVLEKEGPVTASAARERLGRELTEAAVMRALSELWQSLRVLPALQPGGQPALWALTQHHHRAALAKGSSTSQVTAISLLVSMYLQSVYAATNEEIEIFLSPLVSRSRIREAVRGLSATRQIQSLSMDAQTYYFLEGGLPEFAAEAESKRPESKKLEPVRRRQPDISAPPAMLNHASAAPSVSSSVPRRQPAANAARKIAAAGERIARPHADRRPARTEDRRPARPEKPRWRDRQGAPANARPSFGARTGGASKGAAKFADRAGPRRDSAIGRTADRTSGRPFNRNARGKSSGRTAGDWKGKSAAAGVRPGPPAAAKWRKFPQPGERTQDRGRGTEDRPAGPPPSRPAQPQGRPQRRDGGAPWKKPGFPGAAVKPRGEGASRAHSGSKGPLGGAARFPSRNSPPAHPGASRPPYRDAAAYNRGGKAGQGFSPPQRRSSSPNAGSEEEGRSAAPGVWKPAPHSFAKPGSRPGREGKPPGRPSSRFGAPAGGRPQGRSGGYKSAGYRAGGPKKDGPKRDDRGRGSSKPRGFDSKPRSSGPKASRFPGKPKGRFRDSNLGKKKPEA